jgi:hypothetical protein
LNILATVTLNNRKYILNLFDSAGQVNKNKKKKDDLLDFSIL